ncbi:MAG: hypothetical protein ABJA10_09160 [Aestuariivirga sp.]
MPPAAYATPAVSVEATRAAMNSFIVETPLLIETVDYGTDTPLACLLFQFTLRYSKSA